ncbi:MAG TPA: hypothetical protein VFZ27_07845, partial [Terriglobia bacterium]|nr:hypothetical protein [Terriglobia bacterium]
TTFWYGGGIVVSNSENVEVYGNTVKDCMNGIGGTQGVRGTNAKTGAIYNLKNLYVHDNTIIQKTGSAEGIVKSSKLDGSVFTSWGNHLKDTKFSLFESAYRYFCWLDQQWTYSDWLKYASEH